ncbi:TPA: exotoxin beta-grasp domain-containing protein [Staphylococcus aureus]
MKLKTLAKVTLALGLLTTGVITEKSQVVHASDKYDKIKRLYNSSTLHQYYSGKSYKLSNISGQSLSYFESNFLLFSQQNKKFQVFLLGKDENKYKEKTDSLDAFVVPEGIGINGIIYSVGGVTKKNVKTVFGFVSKPKLLVKKTDGQNRDTKDELFFIQKEEVSLKELDFKIRKLLIDKYGLYKVNYSNGTININMKNGSSYKLDLSDKLEFARMDDVIDSKQIENIEVDLK